MPTRRPPDVAARTVRGMLWAYGSYIGLRLSTLLATAVLARLLTPQDFGVVAVATTFIAFLDILQGLGVGQALVIASDEETEDQADTAFTISVALGALLAVLAAALGPFAAKFFHEPILVAVLPVLGSTFFVLALSSTHYALAMRNIDFRSRTVAELADGITRGLTGVTLALAGAGVWSLIVGYVAGNIAMTAILWRLVPWRPKRLVSMRHSKRLLSFGGYITGVGVMAAFLTQFDNLVIGRVLGAQQLGYYSIATKMPSLLILNVAIVAGQVLFPAFSALEGDSLRSGIITSLRYTAAVVFPFAAFLIVLAEPITIAFFGSQWHAAVGAVRVLCLWAVMSPISMVCGNAFMSRGRARLLFLLAIPQAIALVVGSIALAPMGIVAVSWVQTAIAIVAQVVTLDIARRMFDLTRSSLLAAFGPPLLASSILAVVLVGMNQLVTQAWPATISGTVSGALLYLGLLHMLAPDLLPAAIRMTFARPAGQQP